MGAPTAEFVPVHDKKGATGRYRRIGVLLGQQKQVLAYDNVRTASWWLLYRGRRAVHGAPRNPHAVAPRRDVDGVMRSTSRTVGYVRDRAHNTFRDFFTPARSSGTDRARNGNRRSDGRIGAHGTDSRPRSNRLRVCVRVSHPKAAPIGLRALDWQTASACGSKDRCRLVG